VAFALWAKNKNEQIKTSKKSLKDLFLLMMLKLFLDIAFIFPILDSKVHQKPGFLPCSVRLIFKYIIAQKTRILIY
jgi:hypothetical protein